MAMAHSRYAGTFMYKYGLQTPIRDSTVPILRSGELTTQGVNLET